MIVYQDWLVKLLIFIECLCALAAVVQYKKLKETYWKWFAWYVVFIFLSELFSNWFLALYPLFRQYYFAYFGIPIEFIFLLWLYGSKSLHRNKLFWICTATYLVSFVPHLIFFGRLEVVYSLNYTVGNLLLLLLVVLEFSKQIKTDDILRFKENKMFYINAGVTLFYIGTLPFFSFYGLILKQPEIWNVYYIFFLSANCIMYLFFTASFIWGKPKT